MLDAKNGFWRRLDQALAGLNGCKAIPDDILVFVSGANDGEAVKKHDETLVALLQRC